MRGRDLQHHCSDGPEFKQVASPSTQSDIEQNVQVLSVFLLILELHLTHFDGEPINAHYESTVYFVVNEVDQNLCLLLVFSERQSY